MRHLGLKRVSLFSLLWDRKVSLFTILICNVVIILLFFHRALKAITALSDFTYSCTLTSYLAGSLNCSSTFTCERQNESWSSAVSLGDVVFSESESSGVSLPTRCFTYCSQSCAKTRPAFPGPVGFLASFGHMLHHCLRRYGCNCS